MPSFDQLIIAPPQGFAAGCAAINGLASEQPELLQQLVGKSIEHTNYHPQNESEQAHDAEIKVVNFIIRSQKQAAPAPTMPQMATALDSMTFLTRDSVQNIIGVMQEKTSATEAVVAKQPCFGQLRNFKWKMGVAVCSNTCNNLYSPYVSISFDIIQANGQTATYTSEMNFQQFKEFHGSFKQVALLMDNL